HAGSEDDARRRRRGERELAPDLGDEVLAVGEDETPEAGRFHHLCERGRLLRPGEEQNTDVHAEHTHIPVSGFKTRVKATSATLFAGGPPGAAEAVLAHPVAHDLAAHAQAARGARYVATALRERLLEELPFDLLQAHPAARRLCGA